MSKLFDDSSLAMIPSAVKDGKLYSIRPTDGSGDFTFSRGSNLAATRVDVNGLIEKGRENLLLQSNQFDTTWAKTNTSVTSGQSGYDGSSDAWLLNKSAAFGRIVQSISQSGVQTFSTYAKAGTSNWVLFRVDGSSGSSTSYFDLSGSGAVGTTSGTAVIEAKIEADGNGYFRCSIALSDSITEVRIYPAEADNDASATSGSIYIQDAQLEQGLVATDYIETGASTAQAGILEDLPRLDYSGGASCPALLLEPQRSNLAPNSEYLNASNWFLKDIFIEDNADVSPEGLQNASLMYPVSSGTFRRLTDVPTLIGATDTFSFYAKAAGFRYISTSNLVGSVSVVGVTFDLQDGVVAYTKTGEGITAEIEDAGNGWYRCIVKSDGTGAQRFYLLLSNAPNSSTATANGTDGILLWGLQAEAGSYPTSYIPTYGSAVTRSGDVTSNSFVSPSEGTIFVELGEQKEDYFTVLGESFEVAQGDNKIAIVYTPTSLKISHNGSIIVDSTGTYDTSSLSAIQLGHSNGSDQLGGIVKQFTTFSTLLTDTEINALTV